MITLLFRWYTKTVFLTVFGLMLALLQACAHSPPTPIDTAWQDRLLLGDAFEWEPKELRVLSHIDVLAISDDMRQFTHHYLNTTDSDREQLKSLSELLINHAHLGMEYDPLPTYTAQEAFERQQGNCLSYSLLMVALARELDIELELNEVEVPAIWEMHSKKDFVLYKHVNTVLETRFTREVYDLAMDEYDPSYKQYTISIDEAKAQYHNNRAMEHFIQGDLDRAFLFLKVALSFDQAQAYIWSNLGSVYKRHGQLDYAEQAFFIALHYDPDYMVALSNLERLYRQQGQLALAASYGERVKRARLDNPYYMYHLADEALAKGELDEALKQVNRAIKKNKTDHRFFFLRGRIYLAQKQFSPAVEDIVRAKSLAIKQSDRAHYSSKLQNLAGF